MNTIIVDFELWWQKIKPALIAADTWIVNLVQGLWKTDTQIVMADLQKALSGVAMQLQNDAPGTDSKVMAAQLLAAVTTQFVSLSAQLVYADILFVVSAVIKEINPPETPGNAGQSATGDFSGSTTVSPV